MAAFVGVDAQQGRKRKKKARVADDDSPAPKRQRGQKQTLDDRVYGDSEPGFVLQLLQAKKVHVNMKDVQDLVSWLVGDGERAVSPRWVFVRHKALIPSVCLLCADSLGPEVWETQGKSLMPFLDRLGAATPTRLGQAPKRMRKDSFIEELFFRERRVDAAELATQGRRPGQQPSMGAVVAALREAQSAPAAENPLMAAAPAPAPEGPSAPAEGSGAGPSPSGPAAEPVAAAATAAAAAAAAGVAAAAPAPSADGPPPLVVNGDTIPCPASADAAAALAPFLASADDLELWGFPGTESFQDKFAGKLPEFIPAAGAGEGSGVLCLDCEMCLTSDGHELTRCSLVDWGGTVVYDRFVKPRSPIVDYLTRYSGVTEEALAGVTTTLEDVRAELAEKLVGPSTVLLGHSLENDLAALRLTHPRIVDTSLLYPHPSGAPYRSALKYLSWKHLSRSIQGFQGEAVGLGHDPVEDARAALDLVKMKLHFGPMFGMPNKRAESATKDWAAGGGRVALIDRSEAMQRLRHGIGGSVDTLPCSTDDEVERKTLGQLRRPTPPRALWARMGGAAAALERSDWSVAGCADLPPALSALDARIRRVWDQAPPGSALVVLSGQQRGVPRGDDTLRGWEEGRKGLLWLACKPRAAPAAADAAAPAAAGAAPAACAAEAPAAEPQAGGGV
eukprot:TRINITY_DN5732_c0_g2_i1.p1 TRINITY_DN5732_c0_g2~~TRINITY_DN5732_c0_g2_i1.p1  ORF type:complete len:709 (+),score=205.72 TRINITY_DN5732_c0_g2_i1:104-2128(+)